MSSGRFLSHAPKGILCRGYDGSGPSSRGVKNASYVPRAVFVMVRELEMLDYPVSIAEIAL